MNVQLTHNNEQGKEGQQTGDHQTNALETPSQHAVPSGGDKDQQQDSVEDSKETNTEEGKAHGEHSSTTLKLAVPTKSVRRIVHKWKSKRHTFAEDNPRTIEVFHQSLFYLGAFYMTHVWSTTNRIVQQVNLGKTKFGLIAVHSWFDPLQGFMLFVVYQRPRYLKMRREYPNIGRLQAVYRALRFTYQPVPSEWKEVSRTVSNSSDKNTEHHDQEQQEH